MIKAVNLIKKKYFLIQILDGFGKNALTNW